MTKDDKILHLETKLNLLMEYLGVTFVTCGCKGGLVSSNDGDDWWLICSRCHSEGISIERIWGHNG